MKNLKKVFHYSWNTFVSWTPFLFLTHNSIIPLNSLIVWFFPSGEHATLVLLPGHTLFLSIFLMLLVAFQILYRYTYFSFTIASKHRVLVFRNKMDVILAVKYFFSQVKIGNGILAFGHTKRHSLTVCDLPFWACNLSFPCIPIL